MPTSVDTQDDGKDPNRNRAIAAFVRECCVTTAQEAYEDALIRGLCAEGAWEAAVHAMRAVDLDALTAEFHRGANG